MNFKDEEVLAGWENILTKKYQLKLSEIASNYPDKRSIFISYNDIDEYDTDLAMFIMDRPDKCLALGRKAIKGLMPPTWDQRGEVNIRLIGLPRDSRVEIRNLRQVHLRRFVSIEGLVRKVTSVKPRMTKALFKCAKCDAEMWIDQHRMKLRKPAMCNSPDGSCNKATAQFILQDEKSVYVDTQKIEIQEAPEGLRGGAQPERLSGYLEDDMSGVVFPGNRIVLNGIIRSMQKGEKDDSLIFETFIEIHSVEFEQHEYEEILITDEDEEKILEMSRDPNLFSNLIRSISPTIYGLETEKEAIALQLFGGTHKQMDDGTAIRGDIHVLFVGDPGVAKSQLLRYMSSLAPRGIYASGKSASAAGLCVHGDTIIQTESGGVRIREFVDGRMDSPEEYRPGIWRQDVSGERVIAVTENGSAKGLPVTHVWRITTPPFLVEMITVNDDRLVLTPETKILAGKDMRFDWIESKDITPGMLAMVASKEKMILRAVEIKEVSMTQDDLPEFVYDLTVDKAHSFIGNGFAVHNTAAAVKDDFGDGRWTLEAGALVLADKGLACVDELDKMTEQDTSSLHEAMESQKISVAKAGITATLQCRCSLLAAANPKKGRFIDADIADQIDLPPTLMSRFDMIFVLRDKPEPDSDKRLTSHILKAHLRGQAKGSGRAHAESERILEETNDITPVYTQDIMRKYVAYSKKIVPVMTSEALKAIESNYLSIRGTGGGKKRNVPITARQLEAYIRISEASARARLSKDVTKDDADRSIRLMQYYLSKVIGGGDGNTEWDIDAISTGTTASRRDNTEIVLEAIQRHQVENKESKGIHRTELLGAVCEYMKETELEIILDRLSKSGEIYTPAFDTYRLLG